MGYPNAHNFIQTRVIDFETELQVKREYKGTRI